MNLFSRVLWPGRARAPYLRLCLALVLAPLLVAAVLTGLAFLVGGISEPDRAAVIDYTVETSRWLVLALAGFTATFGLAGIAALWSFAQAGMLVWAAAGAVLGGIAGFLVWALSPEAPLTALALAFGVVGWLLFVLIRAIAGIRVAKAPRPAGESPLDAP